MKAVKGYKICDNKIFKIVNFADSNYEIWVENRMTDQERIQEIYKMYIDHDYNFIPGIIHVFEDNGTFKIYDGAHRYLAAKDLYLKNKIDMKMLVYILTDKNKVREDFIEINKSIPVPEIYKENTNGNGNKLICEKVVKYFNDRYGKFKSESNKPRRPNYNQDHLIDMFNDILKELKFNVVYNEIIRAIGVVNMELKKQYENSEIFKKCKEHDFYLFNDSNWSEKIVNNLVQEHNKLLINL